MNVFNNPGSSGVSSEPSAEAVAPQLISEHQPETHSRDPLPVDSGEAGAAPTPVPSEVMLFTASAVLSMHAMSSDGIASYSR